MAKVLVIGSGGREHALAWKLSQSPQVDEVIVAPGNAGTLHEKSIRNVAIDITDFSRVQDMIDKENIELTVIGPEDPLAKGIVNELRGKVFGPRKEAAVLEADKFYSYDILEKLGIPQAKSIKCSSLKQARDAIPSLVNEHGIVLKARGLAEGKGVAVCDSSDEALQELEIHAGRFGEEILVAERLVGEEFSVFGLSDGKVVKPLEISFQDHKPAYDDDKGPNTGGMGAYGPAPVAPRDVVMKVAADVMTPVVQEMKKQGNEYIGFLYAGMMMTPEGPKVIEFNARFGDPECQPAMMMLESDLYEAITAALDGELGEIDLEFREGSACCVVLASKGYPDRYEKGLEISGLDDAQEDIEKASEEGGKSAKVFHAGTAEKNGSTFTAGGRVMGVTAYSENGIKEARSMAYEVVEKITVPGGFHYRKDIAGKALR